MLIPMAYLIPANDFHQITIELFYAFIKEDILVMDVVSFSYEDIIQTTPHLC